MELTIKENTEIALKVNEFLPMLNEQTKAFNSNNSQTTLTHMSLTMLCGQSPMRMIRQTLAEIEKRQMALNEAQVTIEEKKVEIAELSEQDESDLRNAKIRKLSTELSVVESKAQGALKDIATLIDAHNAIKENNNIDEWDETTFEMEEKKFHVRRGFELMYKNLMVSGRPADSTIEYMQQYGVHPQVARPIVANYIESVEKEVAEGKFPHANNLENFLDDCAEKFYEFADATTERIFGKKDITNQDYMLRIKK